MTDEPAGNEVGAESSEQVMASPGRLWMTAGMLALLLAVFHAVITPAPGHRTYTSDGSVYVEGAMSLGEGGGYRFGVHAGSPPIAYFPPFQAQYLRLAWWLSPEFPSNERWMALLMACLAAIAPAAGFMVLSRSGMPPWVAMGCMVAMALTGTWFSCITSMMSDPGFIALVFLAGVAWRSGLARPIRWALVGVLLSLSLGFRFAAAGFIGSVVLFAGVRLFRGDWVPAVCGAFPALVGIWMVRATGSGGAAGQKYLPGGRPNWDLFLSRWPDLKFDGSGEPFWNGLVPLMVRLPEIVGRFGSLPAQATKVLVFLLFIGGVGLAGIGAWRRRRDGWGQFLAVAVLAYVAQVILAATHLADHSRYYLAILPAFLILGWEGFVSVTRGTWLEARRSMVVGVGLAGVVAANLFVLRVTWSAVNQPGEVAELREIAEWARDNTPKDSLVALHSWLPAPQFGAWSGRKLVGDYLANAQEQALHVPHAVQGFARADYVLSSPITVRTNVPAGLLERVATSSSGRFTLHRVDPVVESAYRRSRGLPPPGAAVR